MLTMFLYCGQCMAESAITATGKESMLAAALLYLGRNMFQVTADRSVWPVTSNPSHLTLPYLTVHVCTIFPKL
jgi:hypothetical protein